MASYKSAYHRRPSDDIDPQLKLQKDWHLKVAKHIFSQYVNNKGGFAYSDVANDEINRLYARGEQSHLQYIPLVNKLSSSAKKHPGSQKAQLERKNGMGVNFDDMMTLAPKLMHVILGSLMEKEPDLRALAVDEVSTIKKQDQKLLMEFEMKNKAFISAFSESAQIEQPQRNFVPRDQTQIDMYAQLGGFKLSFEVFMQDAIQQVFKECNWDHEVKKRVLRDLINTNKGATRDYLDPVTQRVKTEYINPSVAIVEASKHKNFKDSNYAGHIDKMSILDIRQMTEIKPEELLKLAKSVCGNYGFDSVSMSSMTRLNDDGSYGCDGWYVDVLHYEFASVDVSYHMKRTINDEIVGPTDRIFPEKFKKGKEAYDKEKTWSNKKLLKDSYKRFYKGIWVLDTDIVLDYGLQHNVSYKDDNPISSYNFIKIEGKSLQDQLRPHHNQIALLGYRLQSAISQLRAEGVMVEYNSLTGMSFENGVESSPLDVLKISDSRGYLIYRAEVDGGPLSVNQNNSPMQRLPGNGAILTDIVKMFDFFNNMISVYSGIDAPSATSTASGGVTATEVRSAAQSSSKVLNDIFDDYVHLKENQAESIVFRMQVLAKYHPEVFKKYAISLGVLPSKIAELSDGVKAAHMGIFLEAAKEETAKIVMLERAAAAMTIGKDGTSAIKPSDYMMIEGMIMSGDVRKAAAYLTTREVEAENKQKEHQKAMMHEQSQAQVNGNKQMNVDNAEYQRQLAELEIQKIYAKGVVDVLTEKAKMKSKFDEVISGLEAEKNKFLMSAGGQGGEKMNEGVQPMVG